MVCVGTAASEGTGRKGDATTELHAPSSLQLSSHDVQLLLVAPTERISDAAADVGGCGDDAVADVGRCGDGAVTDVANRADVTGAAGLHASQELSSQPSSADHPGDLAVGGCGDAPCACTGDAGVAPPLLAAALDPVLERSSLAAFARSRTSSAMTEAAVAAVCLTVAASLENQPLPLASGFVDMPRSYSVSRFVRATVLATTGCTTRRCAPGSRAARPMVP